MPAGSLTLIKKSKYSKSRLKRGPPKLHTYKNVVRSKALKSSRAKVPYDIFGQRKFAKMYYCDVRTVNTDYLGATTQLKLGDSVEYQLNCLQVPRVGMPSGETQPQYLAQYKNIFYHYRVKGAKIRVTCYDPHVTSGSADGLACMVMLKNSQDTYDLTSEFVDEAKPRRHTKMGIINDSGSQKWVFEKYVDMRYLEGLSVNQFEGNVSQYEGTLQQSITGGAPSKIPKLMIALANMSGTTKINANLKVEITYYVSLYDRLTVSSSIALP